MSRPGAPPPARRRNRGPARPMAPAARTQTRKATRPSAAGGMPMADVEAEGRTVNEATEKALAQLNLRRDQVDVTVLSEGRPRLLGFGGEPARVRVSAKPEPAPRPVAPRPEPRAVAPQYDESDGDDD